MTAPALDHETLYRLCANQTGKIANRNILLGMASRVVAAGVSYRTAALAKQLDTVVTMNMSTEERGLASRLYDDRLVKKTGSGRAAYDEIRSSSAICPYCSFGEVYELDHFLPKSAFPDLNVLAINLVPICHPCNHIKLEAVPLGPDDHFLHPYFDVLPDERWLFADLGVAAGGPVLTYRVELDQNQHGLLARRLTFHFRELELDRRFKERAATVLVELEAEISQHLATLGAAQMSSHFLALGTREFELHGNTLETAAYFAAAGSEQYCAGGYQN